MLNIKLMNLTKFVKFKIKFKSSIVIVIEYSPYVHLIIQFFMEENLRF